MLRLIIEIVLSIKDPLHNHELRNQNGGLMAPLN